MLLIESDKRSPEWGTQLAYGKEGDAKFYVPENVYVLGMMNTADRSLSMVDYALRRRFAFVTLEPAFMSPLFVEVLLQRGIPQATVDRIRSRMGSLNEEIEGDTINLGPGYKIGHSFFVPSTPVSDAAAWYVRVVETEIAPLLREYWFDSSEKARTWRTQLLATRPSRAGRNITNSTNSWQDLAGIEHAFRVQRLLYRSHERDLF